MPVDRALGPRSIRRPRPVHGVPATSAQPSEDPFLHGPRCGSIGTRAVTGAAKAPAQRSMRPEALRRERTMRTAASHLLAPGMAAPSSARCTPGGALHCGSCWQPRLQRRGDDPSSSRLRPRRVKPSSATRRPHGGAAVRRDGDEACLRPARVRLDGYAAVRRRPRAAVKTQRLAWHVAATRWRRPYLRRSASAPLPASAAPSGTTTAAHVTRGSGQRPSFPGE